MVLRCVPLSFLAYGPDYMRALLSWQLFAHITRGLLFLDVVSLYYVRKCLSL